MPKHDFMSPKAIANRIKAKGLQKLRWYCQMCNKQCRDENGFKCHTMSEGHIRMMSVFSDSADKFMTDFSSQFERNFMDLLSRRYGQRRVLANNVYNEYIQDKGHVHMNSTIWPTLTDFVKYLGRTGKCVVDETERGWFVQYIDRDPEAVKRQEALDKAKAAEMDDELRHEAEIDAMVAAAHALRSAEEGSSAPAEAPAEFHRPDDADKIKVSMHLKSKAPSAVPQAFAEDADGGPTAAISEDAAPLPASTGTLHAAPQVGMKRGRDVLEGADRKSARPQSTAARLVEEENARRRWMAERESKVSVGARGETDTAAAAGVADAADSWILPGIIVKVLNKTVGGGKFYKQKGTVLNVQDSYIAVLQMDSTGEMLKIDQDDLETVIPALGGDVLLLRGKHRRSAGVLKELHLDTFSATIGLPTGASITVPYEAFSKAARPKAA